MPLYCAPFGPDTRPERNRNQHTTPHSLNILFAEDDRVNSAAIIHLLNKLGNQADGVRNGREAIEKRKQNDYNCILMDIQRPVMDGVQATQAIRADKTLGTKSHIPIITLTAHALVGDREQFINAGMDDYLPKPLDFNLLRNKLEELTKSTCSI